ncbi:Na+/H+ antiporter subunit E [Glycocaulis profundi]|nr:Na+/H+ antiporter subunit E [Glycocaulis profundi]
MRTAFRRAVPYPILTVSLIVMWLLLAGFNAGHGVIAVVVALGATHALKALGEASPPIRNWVAIPKLIGIVLYDIVRSNIAVAGIILTGRAMDKQTSGFIIVPLRLRDPFPLAVLAIVLTSTPGTAWLDYNSSRGELLLHVFDLVDEAHWIDLITHRYERLLMEIFE